MDNIEKKRALSEHDLSILSSEMAKCRKSAFLAYLAFFFFGSWGLHKYYIGKVQDGATYTVLFLITLVLLAAPPWFGIPALLITIGLIGDLFTIPKQIGEVYEKREAAVIARLGH